MTVRRHFQNMSRLWDSIAKHEQAVGEHSKISGCIIAASYHSNLRYILYGRTYNNCTLLTIVRYYRLQFVSEPRHFQNMSRLWDRIAKYQAVGDHSKISGV